MVRAAAKNHATVAIVTSPDALRRRSSRRSDGEAGVPAGLRRRARGRGVPPHRRLRRPDRRGAAVPDGGAGRRRCPTSRACPARRPVPADAHDRAREGRDAPLRREPAPAGGPLPATRRQRRRRAVRDRRAAAPGQGALYNNVLDASAAAGPRARPSRARLRRSSSTRTRAARRSAPTLLEAWQARARRRSRQSAFGGVVAAHAAGRRGVAERLAAIFLEVVVAPAFDAGRARDPRREAEPAARRRPGARRRRRAVRGPIRWVDPDGRRRGPRRPRRTSRRRPDELGRGDRAARPTDARAARPRPRLAARPRRDARTRSCSSATARSIGLGLGPDEPRRRARGRPSTRPARSGRRGPRRGRARRTPSSRSPTRSRSASRPASPPSSSRAARCATRRSSRPSTRPGATMLVTGVRHFRH